jgi:hypothetical protein
MNPQSSTSHFWKMQSVSWTCGHVNEAMVCVLEEGQLRQSEGDIGGSTTSGEQNPGPSEIGDDEEEVPTRRSGRQGKGTWSDKGLAFRGRQ